MESQINDKDVRIMARIAEETAADYIVQENDPWLGSPFEWILRVPSRAKGAIGESLVERWAAEKGFQVSKPQTSDADRIINGHRIEIKLSTLWKSGGFKFQQIRDQNYDFAFCIGISPFDVRAWLIPKDVLKKHVIGHMGQHTGAGGGDTSWIGFKAEEPYDWMIPYGNSLRDVEGLIQKNGRGPY